MSIVIKVPEIRSPSSRSDVSDEWASDVVTINVFGATISVYRTTTLNIPAEVTAIIPRAEQRKRFYEGGQLVSEEEIILNSITVVHAPRHPLHEGSGKALERAVLPEKRCPWSRNRRCWLPPWLVRIFRRKST